jgi:hypothetical protein
VIALIVILAERVSDRDHEFVLIAAYHRRAAAQAAPARTRLLDTDKAGGLGCLRKTSES